MKKPKSALIFDKRDFPISINFFDDEIAERTKNYDPPKREIPPGFMRRYVKLVSSAAKGAVLE